MPASPLGGGTNLLDGPAGPIVDLIDHFCAENRARVCRTDGGKMLRDPTNDQSDLDVVRWITLLIADD